MHKNVSRLFTERQNTIALLNYTEPGPLSGASLTIHRAAAASDFLALIILAPQAQPGGYSPQCLSPLWKKTVPSSSVLCLDLGVC